MAKKKIFTLSHYFQKMIDLKKSSHHVVILILLTLLFFAGSLLTGRDFWVEDEARYAEVLREMMEENQWLVPHLNGHYYPDKPPLYFWLAASFAFITGGITPLPFLLINWLSALGLILTTYFFGRYLFNSFAGFLSALILMSSMLFVAAAQVVRMDMLFSLFITLAIFSFYRGTGRGGHYFLCYLFSALAVLTKGPFGFVFVFLPAVIFLLIGTKPSLCQTSPVGLPPAARGHSESTSPSFKPQLLKKQKPTQSVEMARRAFWKSFCPTFYKKLAAGGKYFRAFFINPGLSVFIILVFGWLVLAALTGHEDFVKNIFSKQIISRAVDSFHHKEPFYYYLLALPPVFLPWFPFLPRAIKHGWPRRRETPFMLLFLWFIPGFLVISLVSCKLFIYLLPLLPPLALFLGYSFSERIGLNSPVGLPPAANFLKKVGQKLLFIRHFRDAAAIEGIAAVLLTFGLLAAAPFVTGYHSSFYTLLFLCIITAGIFLTFLKKFRALLFLIYSGMAVFSLITIIIFAPRLNSDYSPRPISEQIRRYAAQGYRVGAFRVTRGILSFYIGKHIVAGTGPQPMKVDERIPSRLKNLRKKTSFSSMSSIEELKRNDLPAFLNAPQKKLLVIKARALKKLKKRFPKSIPGSSDVGKYIFKLNNEHYLLIPITGVKQNKEEGGSAP